MENPRGSWIGDENQVQSEVESPKIGSDNLDEKELKVLNRIIKYTEAGIQLEADLRHAEVIMSQLGLTELKELTYSAADKA